MLGSGLPLQTLGKTTTAPENHTTEKHRPGLSMEIPMENGNRLSQILFCGFTESVRVCVFYPSILLRRDFAFVAGAGKSILWYVNLLKISVQDS